jgi:hypothetical protein
MEVLERLSVDMLRRAGEVYAEGHPTAHADWNDVDSKNETTTHSLSIRDVPLAVLLTIPGSSLSKSS